MYATSGSEHLHAGEAGATAELGTRLILHEGGAATLDEEHDDAGMLADADGLYGLSAEARAPHRRLATSILSREALRRRLLGVADVVGVSLVLALVLNVSSFQRAALLVAAIPAVLVLFKMSGLYDRDDLHLVQSTLDEAPTLLTLTGTFAVSVVIIKWIAEHGTLTGDQVAALWLGSFLLVFATRSGGRFLAGRISPLERCLVIGEVDRARRIRERLAHSSARATVVASLPLQGSDVEQVERSHELRDLIIDLVTDLEVHRIVVVPPESDGADIVGLIRVAQTVGVRVSVLPRMFEAIGSAVEFDDVDGMTMIGIRRFGLSNSSRFLKRAFDLTATSFGLIAVAPVMLAIAIAIKLDSPGPVLFSQVRVGRDGKRFRILKFRSMEVDAEARKDQLRRQNEAGGGLFKIRDDPRTTRVGGILRRSSLDELPQLLNVLRGDMSLVGPRPLVVDEDALVLGLDRSRLHLTPGMTGPWQVLGTRPPMQEMVGIDWLYVSNWSLWLDIKILFRTVTHVLRRSNV
jgi:exopolysaccharide biosynthesis polyprenyl glycosylphosphotransferase